MFIDPSYQIAPGTSNITNGIVMLDSLARLPKVDGSQLTGLPAYSAGSGLTLSPLLQFSTVGASGTFVSADAHLVTVVNGIIVSIV